MIKIENNSLWRIFCSFVFVIISVLAQENPRTNITVCVPENSQHQTCVTTGLVLTPQTSRKSADRVKVSLQTAEPTNTVTYLGRTYATLSDAPVDGYLEDGLRLSQHQLIEMPSGWEIARNTTDAVAVIASHYWGTNAMTTWSGVSGGATYFTKIVGSDNAGLMLDQVMNCLCDWCYSGNSYSNGCNPVLILIVKSVATTVPTPAPTTALTTAPTDAPNTSAPTRVPAVTKSAKRPRDLKKNTNTNTVQVIKHWTKPERGITIDVNVDVDVKVDSKM